MRTIVGFAFFLLLDISCADARCFNWLIREGEEVPRDTTRRQAAIETPIKKGSAHESAVKRQSDKLSQVVVIEYDRLTNTETMVTSIASGKSIVFKIRNINPFLYDLEINGTLYNWQGTPSSAVSSNVFGQPSAGAVVPGVSQPTPAKPESAERREKTPVVAPPTPPKRLETLRNSLDSINQEFNNKYRMLQELSVLNSQLLATVQSDRLDEAKVKDEVEKIVKGYIGATASLAFTQKGNDAYTSLHFAFRDLKDAYDDFCSAVRMNRSQDSSTLLRWADALYIRAQDDFKPALRDSLTVWLRSAEQTYRMIRNTPFSFSSAPIQATADQIQFTVIATRKQGTPVSTGGQLFKLSYAVDVTKKFKIDFSSGVFFSNLSNKSYSVIDSTFVGKHYTVTNGVVLQQDSVINGKIIIQNTPDKWTYAVGGLVNTYYKFSPQFGAGLSFGVALNVNNQNLQYLLGGSVFLGGQQQFALTLGATLGRVTQLAGGYRTDAPLNVTFNTAPTATMMQSGFFIGISYNFASKQVQTQ